MTDQYIASVRISPRKQLSIQGTREMNIARKGLWAFVTGKGGPTLLLSVFGMSLVKRRSAASLAAAW